MNKGGIKGVKGRQCLQGREVMCVTARRGQAGAMCGEQCVDWPPGGEVGTEW